MRHLVRWVKPATIRTVLSLAVSRDWPIHQLDVKNAFLHGHLSETRSLYRLKQASRAWFQRFASYAKRVGFQHSKTVPSLICLSSRSSDIAYLLLYVDDIILTASSSAFLQRIITSLHSEFAMTDLGSLNYFLGISAQRSATGLFLSQSKFAEEILERAHMQNSLWCSSVSYPLAPRLFFAVQQLHVSSTTQLTTVYRCDWAGVLLLVGQHGYCVCLGRQILSWSRDNVSYLVSFKC
ncbi:ribonuclease H-like domain-containing protein [Tanacetum coccineum]